MIKNLFVTIAFGLLFVSTSNAQTAGQLHFSDAGFSIAQLESEQADSTRQVMIMFLPATDRFAPNVNVMIQQYDGTIGEFTDISLKEFADNGYTVIQHKLEGKSSVLFEYSGDMKGSALHFYARAVKSGGKVYLATATAKKSQWSEVSVRLKKCVDSFRPDKAE